jgi:hypothetical protein
MIMTVVPCGGNVTSPLLGCGPAVLCGVGVLCPFPPVALCDADADAGADVTAWPELPDEGLVAELDVAVVPLPPPDAEVEPDDPPHAASSNTREPSPVAAAHPPLRIISLLTDWHRRPVPRPDRATC